MRRSADTGTIASPIEETASARTGSPGAAPTAFATMRRTRTHTSPGSSSAHPGRGRAMSYSS